MLPNIYFERVYAGVLGKMIGVYLGRPFEGWPYEKIMAELGEIDHYVHEQRGSPLIVTDDDLSGTFTFIRALEDHGTGFDITPEQIGQTWLNYVLEERTIFWWGGMGNSTEHTAFLRLKQGIKAPASGSIATNGKIVAEQIGSQIFIDGWGMVCPGDPQKAADLARRAASVSHDGEAIYGAQVVAAMEAQAFVESDRFKLLDTAVGLIPANSVIYRMISELREVHAKEADWRKAREWIVANYGYNQYVGGCHMVPNHALIILGLLYGDDDFTRSLMITNTSGWDTDCNSANIGCLMGIKLGLEGIDRCAYDWRGPVADRLLLPTADGGSAITDGLREAIRVTNLGLALAGKPALHPKGGARFSFALPGAVQGFSLEQGEDALPGSKLENVPATGPSGERALAIHYANFKDGHAVRVSTPTFILPEETRMPGYSLYASPTLYSGQTVRASLTADATNTASVQARLFLRCYDGDDQLEKVSGTAVTLPPGTTNELCWDVPDTQGKPIFQIGVELCNDSSVGDSAAGSVCMDYLTWDGAPLAKFQRVKGQGKLWRSAWVDGVDHWEKWPSSPAFQIIQNAGRGLVSTGTNDWKNYRVAAEVTAAMGKTLGIGARVQGKNRFYGLFLCNDAKVRLIKALESGDRVLGEVDFPWEPWSKHPLEIAVCDSRIIASIDGVKVFDVIDDDHALTGGGIALICSEGHMRADEVTVTPL